MATTPDARGKQGPGHLLRREYRRYPAALFLAALGLALVSSAFANVLECGELVEAIIGIFCTTIPDRAAGFALFPGSSVNRSAGPASTLI